MSTKFVSSMKRPLAASHSAKWFIFRKFRLLACLNGQEAAIPTGVDLEDLKLNFIRSQYLGTLGDVECFAAEVEEESETPEGWTFQGLRRLFNCMDEEIFAVAGRAVQIIDWDRTNQYCGRCGSETIDRATERAKECTSCGLIRYPRISPAIIVLVRKEDKLLLARAHRHPPGFYSVLAGFVEPGETLEEAVAREIREEVGIEVTNIWYFGSQPWPFPNSLMIAFVCDYAGGEIKVEEEEIADAGWYSPQDLPPVPPKISIARQLIDWFAESVA